MSTTMALAVCIVVFKWTHVVRHPSQGALFYFFGCTAVWSAVTFVGCMSRYLDHREANWANPMTKYTFLVAQIFQVGAAVWLIIAVYEIKRMVFKPRSPANGNRVMRWLVLGVFVFLTLYGLGLILYVTLKWGAGSNSEANHIGHDHADLLDDHHDDDHDDDHDDHDDDHDEFASTGFGHEEQLNFFEALQWGHTILRLVSVVYPIAMSLYIYWRRHDGGERSQILHRQVQLIGLLNSIATVPICLTETAHYNALGVFVQLAQFFYYLSGTVSAVAVGIFLPRFDQLLKSTPRNSLNTPAAISLMDSSSGTDIFILGTHLR
ncbi:hypothetical protein ACHHYP_12549 [Achlya hypogyna]|uniref:Uncharacterized protein n=1 Tax=Achlya hypogyna TaxID=1202772 RepID=A0A1V9YGT2_ACHHY|nr:hypothetical protein ACHHYP_12549 [Achlya hypogyna]